MMLLANGGCEANGAYLSALSLEPQGASCGFWAGKHIPPTPVASAIPLKVSGIGLTPGG